MCTIQKNYENLQSDAIICIHEKRSCFRKYKPIRTCGGLHVLFDKNEWKRNGI